MIGSLPHTCTIQRRYQKQKLSFASGTAAFHIGATVTGGVSGATAVIDKISGTVTAGYLVLKNVSGIFQASELITDNGTPHGSATTSAIPAGYKNDSNEVEYWWQSDQTAVSCRFYTLRAKVTVLTAGQYPGLEPYVILPPTVTINPLDYRILSSTAGYTPASGLYQILSIKAPYNRTSLDHYELELKEIASA
jgi:hypothetical protein